MSVGPPLTGGLFFFPSYLFLATLVVSGVLAGLALHNWVRVLEVLERIDRIGRSMVTGEASVVAVGFLTVLVAELLIGAAGAISVLRWLDLLRAPTVVVNNGSLASRGGPPKTLGQLPWRIP